MNSLTDFQFKIYVGLISHADDEGRISANPVTLAAKIFPMTSDLTIPEKIRDAVIAIESACDGKNGRPLIGLYQIGDEAFIFHPNWKVHQVLPPSRISASKLPPQPGPRNYIEHRTDVTAYGYKLLPTVTVDQQPTMTVDMHTTPTVDPMPTVTEAQRKKERKNLTRARARARRATGK